MNELPEVRPLLRASLGTNSALESSAATNAVIKALSLALVTRAALCATTACALNASVAAIIRPFIRPLRSGRTRSSRDAALLWLPQHLTKLFQQLVGGK